MPLTQTYCPNPADGVRVRAGLLTDTPGIRLAGEDTGELATEWRYRLDETRLSAPDVPALAAAVAAARRDPPAQTQSDHAVSTRRSAGTRTSRTRSPRCWPSCRRACWRPCSACCCSPAALVVERRRAEFALIRARGGAAATIGGRLLGETLLVAPAAVVAGWLAGSLLPGRPRRTGGCR